jgi:hypothetical protein
MRRHQTASVRVVDDYAGADCLIDQSVVPQQRGRADEAGRCQNQDTLPRLFAHESNYVAHIGKHVSRAEFDGPHDGLRRTLGRSGRLSASYRRRCCTGLRRLVPPTGGIGGMAFAARASTEKLEMTCGLPLSKS